ncbi:MAG: PH domain-containing protein [Chloroflexi bacterium]|nr:PH domain-containing protein [Chloroflexota bacterium]
MSYVENLLTSHETILIQQRQHPIRLISGLIGLVWQVGFWLVVFFLLRLFDVLPILNEVWGEMPSEMTSFIPTFIRENLFLSFLGLIILLGLWRYVVSLIQWFSNYTILTNRRVIQVRGVLSKYTSDTSLEKINDVNLSQTTFGRLLGYGNLVIMTASEAGISAMWYLPDPLGFKKAMLDAKEALGGGGFGGSTAASHPTPSADITTRLAKLETLRQQGHISDSEYQARRARILDEV